MLNTIDYAAPVPDLSGFVPAKPNSQRTFSILNSPDDDLATRLYKLLTLARQAADDELRQSVDTSKRQSHKAACAPVMKHSHDFARGIVSQTDEAGIVRTHAWGPLDDENFDESIYPDAYLVRRYRSGSLFQRIPLSDREHYLVLTSNGRTYTWKGSFDHYRQVSIKFVPQPNPFYLAEFSHRLKDAGFRHNAKCISMRYQ
jgi:hypothetical protein